MSLSAAMVSPGPGKRPSSGSPELSLSPAAAPAKRPRLGDELPAPATRAAQRTAAALQHAPSLLAAPAAVEPAKPVTAADVRRVVAARADVNTDAAGPMIGGMDAATRQALVELGYGSPLAGPWPGSRAGSRTVTPHASRFSGSAHPAAQGFQAHLNLAIATPGALTHVQHPGFASPPLVYGAGRVAGPQHPSEALNLDEAQPRRLEKLLSLTLTPGPGAGEAASDASAHTPTLGQPQQGLALQPHAAASPAAAGAAVARLAGQQGRSQLLNFDSRRSSGEGAAPMTADSAAEALTAARAAASPAGPRDLGSFFGDFLAC